MTVTSAEEIAIVVLATLTTGLLYNILFDAIARRKADNGDEWVRWIPSVREMSTLTGLPPRLSLLAVICAAVSIYFTLAVLQGTVFGLFVTTALLIAFLGSYRALARLNRARYLARFESQLPAVMDQMVAQLRGSRTLQTGFRELPAVLPEPASTEIFEIADRAQRGLGLENALIAAGKKFESRNFMLLLAVFRIFARQGGNVIDPLQKMSMAYKDLIKLDEALRTASTQARTMFYIINGAIFFIFSFVSIARPEMIYDIFSNIVGIIIFSVGVIVYVAGAIWMWSMMKVDV